MVQKMLVRYIVSEDGDDFEHPNIFTMDECSTITLSNINKNFPLSGNYSFRVLKTIDNFSVWWDLNEMSSLPNTQNGIYIKATRLCGPLTDSALLSSTDIHAVSGTPPYLPSVQKQSKPELTKKQSALIKFDDDEANSGTVTSSMSKGDKFSDDLMEDNDLLGISSNSDLNTVSAEQHNVSADFFGLQHIQPERTVPNSSTGLIHNTNRLSPMMGGGPIMTHHSPSSSMGSFQSTQQQQHQQSRSGSAPMRGGFSSAGSQHQQSTSAAVGGGMNPMMASGGYDPFSNITGAVGGGRSGQQQQSPFGNINNSSSNSRSAGRS